jgi:hypothetical protein
MRNSIAKAQIFNPDMPATLINASLQDMKKRESSKEKVKRKEINLFYRDEVSIKPRLQEEAWKKALAGFTNRFRC